MGVLNMGQKIEQQMDFEKLYKNGGLQSCPFELSHVAHLHLKSYINMIYFF